MNGKVCDLFGCAKMGGEWHWLVGVGYASEGIVKRLEVELKRWRGVLK